MARFTRDTARAAAAKRYRREVPAPVPEPAAGELPVETAEVIVPPAPTSTPTIDTPPAQPSTAPAAKVETVDGVFTPEVATMLARIAFDVAGIATGRPEIYRATDDELEPLALPLAHQLQRIPVVRAIGPDNTELAIVTVGLGVMVTRRLNEHAAAKQREAAAAGRAPARSSPADAPAREEPAGGNTAELLSVRLPVRSPTPAAGSAN